MSSESDDTRDIKEQPARPGCSKVSTMGTRSREAWKVEAMLVSLGEKALH